MGGSHRGRFPLLSLRKAISMEILHKSSDGLQQVKLDLLKLLDQLNNKHITFSPHFEHSRDPLLFLGITVSIRILLTKRGLTSLKNSVVTVLRRY